MNDLMTAKVEKPQMKRSTDLYRHFDRDGRLLYVGISLNAIARLAQHSSRAYWSQDITTITIERFPNRRRALAAELKAIQNEKPLHNIQGAAGEWDIPYDPAEERAKMECLYARSTEEA